MRPLDFRPITVLSAIYRLWAKVRFVDAMKWQEQWVSKQSWGCRAEHSAEQMAIDVAIDLEEMSYDNMTRVAGASYDFKKCFDIIPVETMLECMERGGASQRILKPLRAMYTVRGCTGLMVHYQTGGRHLMALYRVNPCRWQV